MRAVVQRCLSADVKVSGETIGEIKRGIVVFLGIKDSDSTKEIGYLAGKIIGLRIFEDDAGKSNLSLSDVGGELLIVPNFTIYGDATKGKRPSFIGAASPEYAEKIFNEFVEYSRSTFENKVACGQFGADMKVCVVNDGPFTIIVENN